MYDRSECQKWPASPSPIGWPFSRMFEIIMMPLRSADGTCDRLLGAIAPTAAASWLEIVPLEFLALDRSRLLPEKFSKATPAELRSINEVVAAKGIGFGQAMRRMVSQLLSAEAR